MNVLPQLRDQLTAAMEPRRARRAAAVRAVRPVLVAFAATAAVWAAVALPDRTEERVALPPAGAPADPGPTLGCGAGYVLHRRSTGGADWRDRAVRVGPVTFVGLREQADEPAWRYATAREMAPHLSDEDAEQVLGNGPDRYAAVGLNVLVEPDRSVRIALDPAVREHVGLLTSLPRFGGYLPEDGDAAVRIEGCPPIPPDARRVPDMPETAFGVAFIVRGARCVPIVVTEDGGLQTRGVLSFGAGRCEG